MTASQNCYARALPKISPSRYPSRTLGDCKVFNTVGNCRYLEPLETSGNAIGNVAKVLVRSLTVARAHPMGNALHPVQPCFKCRQSHQQANHWLVHVGSTCPLVAGSLKLQKCLRVALLFASRNPSVGLFRTN